MKKKISLFLLGYAAPLVGTVCGGAFSYAAFLHAVMP